jgi:DNA polymerase III epsilon subunit-like protein
MFPDITVFDFETTNTNPAIDQVVEMAAVRVRHGVEVGSVNALVRLGGRAVFDPKAQEVSGLTPQKLQHAMKEAAAFEMLELLIRGDTVLVAHNILFDYAFLHYGLLRAGFPAPKHNFLCTLTIGRNRQPRPHKLPALCGAYGLEQLPAHRAMNDVRMTLALLQKMDADGNTDHYLNRAGWDGRYPHPTWYPDHAKLVKQRTKAAPPVPKVDPQPKLEL